MRHHLGVAAALGSFQATPLHAETLTTVVSRVLGDVDQHLRHVRDSFALAPAEAGRLGQDLSAALVSSAGVRAVTFAIVLVIVGCGLEWLYWIAAAAPYRAVVTATASSPRRAAALAGRRLALGSFGLAVFAVATLTASVALPWPPDVAWLAATVTLLLVSVRTVWLLASISTSPHHPSLRPGFLPPGRDRSAVALGVWIASVLATAALLPGLVAKLGLAPHFAVALRVVLVALVALTGLVVVIVAEPARPAPRLMAGRWPVPRFPLRFAIAAAVVALFAVWLAGGGKIAVLLLDAAATALLLTNSRRATANAWRDDDGDTGATEAAPTDRLGFIVVLSTARLTILMVGMAVAFLVIDLPLDALISGSSPAARAVLRLGGVVALVLVAQTCWIALRIAIDRRLGQLAPLDPHDAADHTRLLTLLPLLRTTLLILFVVLFGLSALWTLGIEITPLLAGAGIFGLAIGFGAQTLVRDVISGVFFMVEDVFRIGEYIESGSSTKGTVERITLRTVALRHQNGPIHFVPYGALGTVRNTSRDWVIDKFELPLPVTVDSERMRKLVKRVGEDLLQDQDLGPLFREPLKAKLSRIDPGVKVFRCKFMTLPGRQFDLRAAALKGIEAALAEAGIPFADRA